VVVVVLLLLAPDSPPSQVKELKTAAGVSLKAL